MPKLTATRARWIQGERMVAKWNCSGVLTRLCEVDERHDEVVCPFMDFVPRIDESLDCCSIDMRSRNEK
jgi:hypothetical protein